MTASVRPANDHGSYWITEFPGCRYFCALEIRIEQDSVDRSLEQYVANLRVIDTSKNPDAADWIPGPPHRIDARGQLGMIMETSCGDCASAQVVVKRGRTIATLGYSLDDRDGYQPGLMCRMARVASTFQWRSP